MLKPGSLTGVEECQTDLLGPREALPCLLSHQPLDRSLPVFGVPGESGRGPAATLQSAKWLGNSRKLLVCYLKIHRPETCLSKILYCVSPFFPVREYILRLGCFILKLSQLGSWRHVKVEY